MTWWMIAAALVVSAPAQESMAGMAMKPAAVCPATPAPLPAAFAGWTAMTATDAATGSDAAPSLQFGTGARVTLRPTPQLHFAASMKHMGEPATFGGLLAFTITRSGRYHVALGAPAWIDVVRDGATLTSVGHGHGPDCSGIRKMVDFELTPGNYLLQVAGNDAPTLGVMVTAVAD